MMFFRNPEIKRVFLLYFIFGIAAASAAAFFHPFAVIYVGVVCILSAFFFGMLTAGRYSKISHLTGQLDQLLHSQEMTCFAPDREGELALLTTEISKLILRLGEQTELLTKEKSLLANSIADISHQIRTPLTSIRMITPRLRRPELAAEQREEHVREISNLLSRMEWLVDALLKIARLESDTVVFQKTEFDVADLIEKALEPLAVFIEIKELDVHLEIPSDTSMVGDFLWCVEAVGNILKNCVEHIPEGESLTIRAAENPIYTEILLSDTGQGIAAEDLPHLFRRFYKGSTSGPQNAGIGLALSHMIISRQNGTVKVSNRIPHGAEFQIRFYI